MKPPKKIYAKVEVKNNQEVLRLSTSPFRSGNIEYMLPQSTEQIKYRPFVSVSAMLPATDGTGKCRYALEVLRRNDNKIHIAYFGIAGFFSDRCFYYENKLTDVYAWRYIIDRTQLNIMSQDWGDHDTHVIFDTIRNGTVIVHNYPSDSETWISGLYVAPEYRHLHVANNLLDEAERHAKFHPIKVGVVKDAPSWLLDFYKKRGYEIVNEE